MGSHVYLINATKILLKFMLFALFGWPYFIDNANSKQCVHMNCADFVEMIFGVKVVVFCP